MRFTKAGASRRTAILVGMVVLFSFAAARTQDTGASPNIPRTDRPELSIMVRDRAGEPIATAGSVKLYRDTVLADETGLSHGRAFFGSLLFGNYTVVVDAAGYKSVQRDLNISVAMRYEVEANLQRDSDPDEAPAAPAKPLLAPKAKEALDKSLKALSANKLSDAQKYVAEAVKLAPFHPDVLYVQGVVFLDQKNWAQAQTTLEKASQMDPTNARAFSALGMAFVDQGKYDQAIPPLEKSLQLDNSAWDAHWALGKAYYHQQLYDEALKMSQLALTESNGKAPQIELLVAQAQTAVGKYEDAAQSLRDYIKHHGDQAEAATARRWLDGLAKNGKIRSN